MLISGTIFALCCFLLNAHANAEPGDGQVFDRCTANSRSRVSCGDGISPDALIPHPDDCGLFYYCVHPSLAPVCRQCPDGLHFSPTLHVCDWPEQARCQPPSTTVAPAPQSDACPLQSEARISCADQRGPLALVPDPVDCRIYYFCLHPALLPLCLQCPDDLVYNPDSHLCVPPELYGCGAGNWTQSTDAPISDYTTDYDTTSASEATTAASVDTSAASETTIAESEATTSAIDLTTTWRDVTTEGTTRSSFATLTTDDPWLTTTAANTPLIY